MCGLPGTPRAAHCGSNGLVCARAGDVLAQRLCLGRMLIREPWAGPWSLPQGWRGWATPLTGVLLSVEGRLTTGITGVESGGMEQSGKGAFCCF